MTNDEFTTEYWPDFRARFPGKASWFAKAGELSVGSWYDVLQSVDLADALEANRRVQNGECDLEGNWDEIPKAIRNIAEQVKIDRICSSYRSAEEPPEVSHGSDRKPWVCQLCDNTGLVRKSQWIDGKEYETAFACRCKLGDKFAIWKKRDGTVEECQRIT